ncbi:hypothetical protein MWU49_01875 [Alcanivorax sp. S6407]|uniref:hypothetical protein n=1 Tax=Alcanivorax sp. S6407 TaxID=2926424 RepID=UPI001FF5D082|nr:hypothetical protein [Alcanivorax sp. S6407]MCK0152438.1 hypothetical protein [Alcanivorax sp. S6407]
MTLLKILSFPLLLLCANANAQCRFDPLDQGKVMQLSAHSLPSAQGLPLSDLSLMRVENGELIPVAFQFDEMSDHDMVWFEHSGFDQLGQGGVLDADDRLLAMLTDAGPQRPDTLLPAQGQVVADLEVANNCHFYLVKDNPLRSDNYYVSHDTRTGQTRTALYQLDVDPENELNWRYLGYRSYQGSGSIIDTLKMRMSAGVLSKFTRMTLDNHNLRPQLVGHRAGPIRSVMHLRTRVVLAGIPVMTIQVQAMRYAAHYEAHTYAKVPELYRATLKEPEVSVTVDGNNQMGANVYTHNFADNPVTVNGVADDASFAGQPISMAENWILFDSNQQFTLLTELSVPESLMSVPLQLIYEDDTLLSVEPEQFQGQLPNLGYMLKGWPEQRELRFTVSMFFDSSMRGFSAGEYADQRARDVAVHVTP